MEFQKCVFCRRVVQKVSLDEADYLIQRKMIIVMYPKMRPSTCDNLFVCVYCDITLKRICSFKTHCLDVDNFLKTFLKSDNKIDMKKVLFGMPYHMLKNPMEKEMTEICRLCLDRVHKGWYESDANCFVKMFLESCLPELDLMLLETSNVCCVCVEQLRRQHNFICDLVYLEKSIDSDCKKEPLLIVERTQLVKNNVTNCDKSKRSNQSNNASKVTKKKSKTEIISESDTDESDSDSDDSDSDDTSSDDSSSDESSSDDSSSHESRGDNNDGNNMDDKVKSKLNTARKRNEDEPERIEDEIEQCTQCEYVTKKKYGLKFHNSLVHTDEDSMISKREVNGVTTYACKECSFDSTRDYIVWSHLVSHRDRLRSHFNCQHCDYNCKKESTLRRHESKHKSKSAAKKCQTKTASNNPLKVYHCMLCSFKLQKRTSMENHIYHHIENNVTVRHCKHCDYQTNSRWRLCLHESVHGTGTEPESLNCFECIFCQYKASKENKFRKHCDDCAVMKSIKRYYITVYLSEPNTN